MRYDRDDDISEGKGVMNGADLLCKLEYVLRVCPKADDNAAASHVVFYEGKLVASDTRRLHIGYVSTGGGALRTAPVAVTRENLLELLDGLTYAVKISRRQNASCYAYREGPELLIQYGRKNLKIEHELMQAIVGTIPSAWEPPVSASEEMMATEALRVDVDHMRAALKWPNDRVDDTIIRCAGDGRPVRVDLIVRESLAATAILLPRGRKAIQLDKPQQDLFVKGGRQMGSSVLDLVWEQMNLDLGDRWKRLEDPDSYTVFTPCPHEKTPGKVCHPCTVEKMDKALEEQKAAASRRGTSRKRKADGE